MFDVAPRLQYLRGPSEALAAAAVVARGAEGGPVDRPPLVCTAERTSWFRDAFDFPRVDALQRHSQWGPLGVCQVRGIDSAAFARTGHRKSCHSALCPRLIIREEHGSIELRAQMHSASV